jgi:hypothetical protein
MDENLESDLVMRRAELYCDSRCKLFELKRVCKFAVRKGVIATLQREPLLL